MKCPECGHEILSDYLFCPKCGARIDRAAPSPELAFKTHPQHAVHVSHRALLPKHVASHAFALVGGLVIALGCFLPWSQYTQFGARGTDFAYGTVTLIGGVLVIGLAAASLALRQTWLRLLLLGVALASSALGAVALIDIARVARAWQAGFLDFVDLGILVVLAGAFIATVSSLINLRAGGR